MFLKTIFYKVDLEISNKPKIWWILAYFFQLLLLTLKQCQYIFRQYITKHITDTIRHICQNCYINNINVGVLMYDRCKNEQMFEPLLYWIKIWSTFQTNSIAYSTFKAIIMVQLQLMIWVFGNFYLNLVKKRIKNLEKPFVHWNRDRIWYVLFT